MSHQNPACCVAKIASLRLISARSSGTRPSPFRGRFFWFQRSVRFLEPPRTRLQLADLPNGGPENPHMSGNRVMISPLHNPNNKHFTGGIMTSRPWLQGGHLQPVEQKATFYNLCQISNRCSCHWAPWQVQLLHLCPGSQELRRSGRVWKRQHPLGARVC